MRTEYFSRAPEMQQFGELVQAFKERLPRPGCLWIGPDLAVPSAVVIAPGASHILRLPIAEGSLPFIPQNEQELALIRCFVRKSGRSRVAQIHAHPRYSDSDSDIIDVDEDGLMYVETELQNLGSRGVIIPKNEGAFRFFSRAGANHLTGRVLKDVIEQRGLIEGEENEDWKFFGENGFQPVDQPEGACAIAARLTGDRYVIPPSNDPLDVCTDIVDYRGYLKDLFRLVPDNEFVPVYTTQTRAVFRLPDGLNIVIGSDVCVGGARGQHLNSPLIPGGLRIQEGNDQLKRMLTAWRLRCEVYFNRTGRRPQPEDYKNQWAMIFLFQDGG